MSARSLADSRLSEKRVGGAAPWVRPADWISLPAVTGADQKFVGLHAVYPNSNFVALSAAGAYTVDWGDGTVENFASGAVAQHEYNYATYDVENATLCSRGYKQAVVTVTPQAGQNLTAVNLHQRHSATSVVYGSGFLDVAVSGQYLTDLRMAVQTVGGTTQVIRFNSLERATVIRSATTSFSYLFYNCHRLQEVSIQNSPNVTNMSGMFHTCSALVRAPWFDTALVTSMSSMFYNCWSLVDVPLFNTVSVTSMASMFQNCYSLTRVPLFNTVAVSVINTMFQNCTALETVPLFNTASVQNFNGMFYNCPKLRNVPLFNMAVATNTGSMFYNCGSLTSVPFFNTVSVTSMATMFQNCTALMQVPTFNTAACTNMSGMFNGCTNLVQVPALNANAVTPASSFTNFAAACSSLSKISMTGMKVSFSLANCKLSAAALNEIYSNLATATGQTITVTGNFGTADHDPSIATAKGWTVTV